ncbi:hypothetical protein R6Q59_016932 [Mikania micrantha]
MGETQKLVEDKKENHHHQQQHEGSLDPKIWDCGSPLYDSHELVSITNVLDRHMMKFPHVFNRPTRSITHPSSYLSMVPVRVAPMATHPPRNMNECVFIPSFKPWKIKTIKAAKLQVGMLKYCHRIVSWWK